MGIDHIFDAVCNQVAAGQRIEHAVMAHRNSVIDCDSVELLGNPAGSLDFASDHLAKVLEVDVPRNKLGKAVDDSNDWLSKIAVLHARCTPKPARTCHIASVSGSTRAKGWHLGDS